MTDLVPRQEFDAWADTYAVSVSTGWFTSLASLYFVLRPNPQPHPHLVIYAKPARSAARGQSPRLIFSIVFYRFAQ
ncbi:MAG: hypothetical protein WCE68_04100 [Anaerolineales bacterium]